jgi:hypothetical protein
MTKTYIYIKYAHNYEKQSGGYYDSDQVSDVEHSGQRGGGSNPPWPPYIDSNIIIEKDGKTYKGIVAANIENDTETIVRIEDDTYVELSLVNNPGYSNGKGFMKFYKTNSWKYTDIEANIGRNTIKKEYLEFRNKLNKGEVDDDIDLTNLVPDSQRKYVEDFYRPLLSKMTGNFFSDKKLDIVISNNEDVFKSLDSDVVAELKKSLLAFKTIDDDEMIMMVNRGVAIKNLITDPQDEINEGSKIIEWIEKNLKTVKYEDKTIDLFSDLVLKIDTGYVYITRKGVELQDKVTEELIPDLKHFSSQYGKPIEYHTLKYVIFQNNFQKQITDNIIQKKEAERILSLEYIIALQPSSKFQYWCLKRLLTIWYGDSEIEPLIKKIKVLINHYRADASKDYNKVNGCLPMILIYINYGIASAQKVISKLEYYFSLYVDDDNSDRYTNIYMKDSHPTYFIKKNNLIYFSNGSIDLKLYIEKSLDCTNNKPLNDIFDKNYKEMLESGRVLSN